MDALPYDSEHRPPTYLRGNRRPHASHKVARVKVRFRTLPETLEDHHYYIPNDWTFPFIDSFTVDIDDASRSATAVVVPNDDVNQN